MIQQATWQVAFQLDAPYNGDGVFMDDDHDDDDDGDHDHDDDVDCSKSKSTSGSASMRQSPRQHSRYCPECLTVLFPRARVLLLTIRRRTNHHIRNCFEKAA